MSEKLEKIDWGRDFVSKAYLMRPQKQNDLRAHQFYWQLNPFIKDFYNPINPVVLSVENNLEALFQKNILMVRDGLIPLTYFFKQTPVDPKIPILFIHKDFWFLVPDEWRSHVNYYSIESNYDFNVKNKYKRVLLTGLTNGVFVDEVEFNDDLDFLIETLGKENLKDIEFSVYLPMKGLDLWGNWGDENILKTMQTLFKKLGTNLSFPGLRDIQMELNFKDSVYFEFNRGHILKETFLKNLILSRGAHFLERKNEDKFFINKGKIQASLNHCINLYTLNAEKAAPYLDPTSSQYFNYFKDTLNEGAKGAQLHPDWDNWFATFLKRYSKFKDSYQF